MCYLFNKCCKYKAVLNKWKANISFIAWERQALNKKSKPSNKSLQQFQKPAQTIKSDEGKDAEYGLLYCKELAWQHHQDSQTELL